VTLAFEMARLCMSLYELKSLYIYIRLLHNILLLLYLVCNTIIIRSSNNNSNYNAI